MVCADLQRAQVVCIFNGFPICTWRKYNHFRVDVPFSSQACGFNSPANFEDIASLRSCERTRLRRLAGEDAGSGNDVVGDRRVPDVDLDTGVGSLSKTEWLAREQRSFK